jgi:glyoxylase-like metal-dependent hydrolase (beta-lactamase superfamily II)
MSLVVETFPAGPIETNAYLVFDENTNDALIIDAPFESVDLLTAAAAERGVKVGLIVITHAHWDHIGDSAAMKAAFGVPLATHRLCQAALEQPASPSMDLPLSIDPATVDRLIDEGDEVQLGSHTFQVLHLPGHEPGHTALYSEPDLVLLSGDVLFPNGHGRIDIPGASEAQMAASLSRLAGFPKNVTVYPGHGLPTTIGAEPWLQSYAMEGGSR